MPCSLSRPNPVPIDRLRSSAYAFALLSQNASKLEVTNAYLDYRQALFDAMVSDVDASCYDVARRTIKFADKEIGDFQELPAGNEPYQAALEHLKLLLKSSSDYVPWR